MSSILIHIGYHKTGTTWVQRFLFESEAVGFSQPFQRGEDVGEWLVEPHDLDFDPDVARDHLLPLEKARPGTVPALSHERLSGHPHSGGYDTAPLADRLAAVFPGARILITVREQTAAIVSSYQQYVRSGSANTIRDYLVPPEMGRNRIPAFTLRHFEYDRAIRYYRELFGADRVLVLAFERFETEPVRHVQRIVGFAGARPADGAIEALPFGNVVNASESVLSLGVRRRANLMFGRSRMHPTPLLPLPGVHKWLHRHAGDLDRIVPDRLLTARRDRLRAAADAVVGDHFVESNRRMAGLVDFDLAALGYRM